MLARCPATVLLLASLNAFGAIDYQRDVRPILSNNCFACHGPDKETRMADLRLDQHDDAVAARRNGPAIVPGDVAKSLVYQRITAPKPALRMPPVASHKTLTPQQIETIKGWIEQGAQWKEHWSFIPPRAVAPPDVKNTAWVRNPIDRFILAKLEALGLQPAVEADCRRLLRRVTLDLTGLPPTTAEVAAFAEDRSENAYEKAVDRLLASPRWGEHRARYWLDAARYADTHGIHVDNYREMWPYRDWVINAFNRNERFDQFTIEQLAGDLLPNRTLDQQIATGFHRCNVTTNEAGIILDEFESIYSKDRADTTSTVWLGLTVGCATCHDHKFDAISQRDHYAMEAFFRNTTQAVMDGNISDTPPIVVVPKPADRARWNALQNEERALKSEMQALVDAPAAVRNVQPKRPLEDKSEIFARSEETSFADKHAVELPNLAAFDVNKPFSISFRLRMPQTEGSVVVASQYDPAKKGRGWLFEVGARVPNFRLTGDEGNNLDARAPHHAQLMPAQWNHVVVTYDGSGERLGLAMFLNGKAVVIQGSEPLTKLKGNFKTTAPLRLGSDGKRFFDGGTIADFRIYNRALTEDEAALAALWPEIQSGEPKALRLYSLHHEDAAFRGLQRKLAAVGSERTAIRHRAAITHVMEERTDRKPFANILYRGAYDQPRDRVDADVPGALPPMAASLPHNRLGLAEWLMDPANPLTARVTVNRFWQEVFGTGLVRTAEDFGAQGEAPSHPELLDWLAIDFRDSGWDIKRLYKMMVMSAAYRQAAAASEDAIRKDPENRLLSRGPRFRMDAEMVRDYALAVSGLLAPTIGGPSVKPYQPDNVWETVAMLGSNTRFYKRDEGDKLYRRSMYTFWKRSAPPASMDIFNAPTREQCTVRRERTDTPLQALVTMNDVQFVEAARTVAQHVLLSDAKDLDSRLKKVSDDIISRPLEPRELEIARREYKDYLNYYDSHPDDAKKLLAVGDSKADAKAPQAEFAAMTMLVNQFLNLDEVLNK